MNNEFNNTPLTHEEEVSKYKEQYIQESYQKYSDLLNAKILEENKNVQENNTTSNVEESEFDALIVENNPSESTTDVFDTLNIDTQSNKNAIDENKPLEAQPKVSDEERKKLFDYDFNNFVVTNNKHNCNDPLILENPNPEDKVNYSNFFSSIYNAKINERNTPVVEPEIPAEVTPSNVNYTEFNNINFSSIKNSLHSEGYTFKIYIKKDSSGYYVNKFYYINKIYMHSSLIMYFLILAESLLAFFLMKEKYQLVTWHLPLSLGILALVPIIGIINYLSNKKHKVRRKFALKNSLTNSIILEFNVILIIALLAFMVFNINIDNKIETFKGLYVPILFTLNIPLYTLITAMLSKSHRYYIS